MEMDNNQKSNKKEISVPEELIRLNKYISNSGVCSRRDADELISAGHITVNGKKITDLGTRVKLTDDVRYKGDSIRSEKKVYILLNKPRGYVTTMDDPHADQTFMDLIKNACDERVYPVGRLDKATTGVLLLTNDGDLTSKLTHPKYNKKKIYHAFLNKPVTKNDLIRLTKGVNVGEVVTADAATYPDIEDKTQVGIEIHSGQNRVVRLMFEVMGYSVKKLDRVYFAGLTKKKLPRGKWRFLSDKEISMLKRGAYN